MAEAERVVPLHWVCATVPGDDGYETLDRLDSPEQLEHLRSVADAHECPLERLYQQGIDEGGRVRERLQDGVKAALEELGDAFLAHPASVALPSASGKDQAK